MGVHTTIDTLQTVSYGDVAQYIHRLYSTYTLHPLYSLTLLTHYTHPTLLTHYIRPTLLTNYTPHTLLTDYTSVGKTVRNLRTNTTGSRTDGPH